MKKPSAKHRHPAVRKKRTKADAWERGAERREARLARRKAANAAVKEARAERKEKHRGALDLHKKTLREAAFVAGRPLAVEERKALRKIGPEDRAQIFQLSEQKLDEINEGAKQ